MELSTVLELVKAGFSKDEIMQMAQPQTTVPNPEPVQMEMDIPAPKEEPIPAPVDVPVAVAVPEADPQPQQAQVPAQPQPTMADIMQSIAKLTSAVQANAIANSTLPAGINAPVKAEDIVAEIIRPTYGGKHE